MSKPRQAQARPGRSDPAGRLSDAASVHEPQLVGAEPEDDADADGDDLGDIDRPSKSALKREAHELQHLGDQLAALPADRLAAIPMDEALRDAIHALQRTRSHEGKRRQRQYVGKLMRHADAEPLREAVAAVKLGSAKETLNLHRIEAWRAELAADDAALTRFVQAHPGCEVQPLRSLIRQARKEAALPPEQRHGRAWRELFQYIKPFVVA
jgi:ribosome-associated protein